MPERDSLAAEKRLAVVRGRPEHSARASRESVAVAISTSAQPLPDAGAT